LSLCRLTKRCSRPQNFRVTARPFIAAFSMLAPAIGAAQEQAAAWPVTEGQPGGGRYSPLADIHTGNVDQLEQVWVYRHGDYFDGGFPFYDDGSSSETTPILV